MTNFASQSLSVVLAALVAIALWSPTLAPGPQAVTASENTITLPQLA